MYVTIIIYMSTESEAHTHVHVCDYNHVQCTYYLSDYVFFFQNAYMDSGLVGHQSLKEELSMLFEPNSPLLDLPTPVNQLLNITINC